MLGFSFHNPVRLVYGVGAVEKLGRLLPGEGPILLVSGGGSCERAAWRNALAMRSGQGPIWTCRRTCRS